MSRLTVKYAGDYMSPVETFPKSVPVMALVDKVLTDKLRVAVMIDPANQHPVGVLTRSDLMRVLAQDIEAQEIREGTAERLMNSPFTISETAILSDVVRAMTRPIFLHSLLVTDMRSRVVGVLYQEDVIRWWRETVGDKKD
jgi:CBS domain-containing protein